MLHRVYIFYVNPVSAVIQHNRELRYTLLHILCYTECVFYVNPVSAVIQHNRELRYTLLHILCYTECIFYVNPVSVVIKHHSIIFGDVRFRACY